MEASDIPVLECDSVCKQYAQRSVLRGVSFRLYAGERLALTGPSGSGKSTLLNCLGGVDRPSSGAVYLLGEAYGGMDGDALALLRRRRIGTIFQFFHLLPTLSVRENVEFPLVLLGVAERERRARAEALLERVQIEHRAGALPAQLSGGEMQRCAIARALVHRPALLLADEPTGNLDSQNGANILSLLSELSSETGAALVLVTHSEEAAAICPRRVVMKDGVFVEKGS